MTSGHRAVKNNYLNLKIPIVESYVIHISITS